MFVVEKNLAPFIKHFLLFLFFFITSSRILHIFFFFSIQSAENDYQQVWSTDTFVVLGARLAWLGVGVIDYLVHISIIACLLLYYASKHLVDNYQDQTVECPKRCKVKLYSKVFHGNAKIPLFFATCHCQLPPTVEICFLIK